MAIIITNTKQAYSQYPQNCAPVKRKITMSDLEKDGATCITKLYIMNSECTGGQFADNLVEDLTVDFQTPLNISLIMNCIQTFRSWDREDDDDLMEVDAEINMLDQGDGFLVNEYHDYMYSDKSFVPRGIRIGIENADGSMDLDEGIFYSSDARTEELNNAS